ncbi:MAG: exodeoxyribonuclease VII small subunit [Erythrobacter sp.]
MDEGKDAAAMAGDISQMSFEEALAALEEIVKRLERGDVPLDESISLYEQGEKLRTACQNRLDAAQARIERIVTAADGSAAGAQPFDAQG